jgi:hypothetical protein
MVMFWGVTGYLFDRPDWIMSGATTAVIALLLLIGAWSLWRRRAERRPVPATEYLAVVWLLTYLGLIGVTASRRDVSLIDSFFLLPPVSFAPAMARVLIGDDGDPGGRARSVAQWLHRTLGWALTTLGVFFVISVFFVFAALLPLVPGLLHLRAASAYRAALRGDEVADPSAASV